MPTSLNESTIFAVRFHCVCAHVQVCADVSALCVQVCAHVCALCVCAHACACVCAVCALCEHAHFWPRTFDCASLRWPRPRFR